VVIELYGGCGVDGDWVSPQLQSKNGLRIKAEYMFDNGKGFGKFFTIAFNGKRFENGKFCYERDIWVSPKFH